MENKGMYHDVYLKKDGQFISLAEEAKIFCETWIKPVRPENWDWTKRDFDKPENDPTIEEARVIRNLILQDIHEGKKSQIDLSNLENGDAIAAFFNPESEYEAFNMEEFAFALKVELEHGKVRDANVTNNHPFLTAMIVLAHMSETVTYYKRLQVMELEGEIFEMERKLEDKVFWKKGLEEGIQEKKEELKTAKAELEKRIVAMKEIPVLKKVGD